MIFFVPKVAYHWSRIGQCTKSYQWKHFKPANPHRLFHPHKAWCQEWTHLRFLREWCPEIRLWCGHGSRKCPGIRYPSASLMYAFLHRRATFSRDGCPVREIGRDPRILRGIGCPQDPTPARFKCPTLSDMKGRLLSELQLHFTETC